MLVEICRCINNLFSSVFVYPSFLQPRMKLYSMTVFPNSVFPGSSCLTVVLRCVKQTNCEFAFELACLIRHILAGYAFISLRYLRRIFSLLSITFPFQNLHIFFLKFYFIMKRYLITFTLYPPDRSDGEAIWKRRDCMTGLEKPLFTFLKIYLQQDYIYSQEAPQLHFMIRQLISTFSDPVFSPSKKTFSSFVSQVISCFTFRL